jgi:syntaxin 5
MKDRTNEFHAAVESLLQRGGVGGRSSIPERSRLLDDVSGNSVVITSKSEFARASAAIARDINSTMGKLHKLTQLAKKKSLFDDRPVEINELIYIIKQDIQKINLQIKGLSSYLANYKATGQIRNKQSEEHSSQVITSLQSKLASTSSSFKTVLEIRTQTMKDQKSRRDQYSFSNAPTSSPLPSFTNNSNSNINNSNTVNAAPLTHAGPVPQSTPQQLTSPAEVSSLFTPAASFQSPLYNQDSNGLRNRTNTANGDVVLDLGMGAMVPHQQQQQQQLLYSGQQGANLEYINSRAEAIESIESTIAELGSIYQQFAQILSTQRDMVQRIDDNVVDVEMNVMGGEQELMRYFQNMSSNRWLMIKVFAVLIAFFLLFVLLT